MSNNNYISFDEFVENSGFKKKTVINRIKKNEIPGITIREDKYFVLSGTRYPCDIHRYKLKDSSKRRYVLLKSISEYKYISHRELKIEENQFVEMIKDLLCEGLIRENNLSNKYGGENGIQFYKNCWFYQFYRNE